MSALTFALAALIFLPLSSIAGNPPGRTGCEMEKPSALIPAWNDDKEPRNFLVDSLRLDTRILDTMAARLGARPAWSGRDT
jgi:hypothetical protein